jgi:hypothetical protein
MTFEKHFTALASQPSEAPQKPLAYLVQYEYLAGTATQGLKSDGTWEKVSESWGHASRLFHFEQEAIDFDGDDESPKVGRNKVITPLGPLLSAPAQAAPDAITYADLEEECRMLSERLKEADEKLAEYEAAPDAQTITNDQCIELAEALVWEKVRRDISETREVACRFKDGTAFRAGMETALEELEARLGLVESSQSPQPSDTRPSRAKLTEFIGNYCSGDSRLIACAEAAFAYLGGSDTQPSAFPERDPSKPAEQQGIFRKFIVERVDGSDKPGGKHDGCRYFVLDLDHDKHAPAAMRAYATDCAETHQALSADILAEFSQPSATEEAERDRIDAERWRLACAYEDNAGLLYTAVINHGGGNNSAIDAEFDAEAIAARAAQEKQG